MVSALEGFHCISIPALISLSLAWVINVAGALIRTVIMNARMPQAFWWKGKQWIILEWPIEQGRNSRKSQMVPYSLFVVWHCNIIMTLCVWSNLYCTIIVQFALPLCLCIGTYSLHINFIRSIIMTKIDFLKLNHLPLFSYQNIILTL